jgi:hypothetical protein
MIETSKQKLGAIGGIVGDFARGVGATADIPKTIVTGTQTSYGANIPTVEDTRQKLAESTPSAGGIIKDVASGVSKAFNTASTPAFGAAVNQPLLNLVKSGATTPTTTAPVAEPPKDEGRAGATSFNLSDKELTDWKARGDLQNSSYYDGKNPNDDKFAGLMKDLVDTASSGSPSVERATKLNALKTGIQALAPQTSFGHFGVTGIQAETTRRGQDIESEIRKPYYEANAEESKAKGKLYGTQAKLLEEEGKPDKVREKEVSGWLTERQKVINASLGELEGLSEEEKATRMNARVADFNKYNPPPIKSAKKNADGTVTVQYADGTVKTGKPVK